MESNYNAEFYDLTHDGSMRGDVEWYCRLAKESGGPVLELGAGTGRTVIPVAREGIEICALDKDKIMLDKLKKNLSGESSEISGLVKIVEEDMRRFKLDKKFKLIQIPFRAFLSNVTREDQRACLECCNEHLDPGGKLAFNVFHPSLDYMSRNSGALERVWRLQQDIPVPDGGFLTLSESNRYDTINQNVFSYLKWERYEKNGNLISTFTQKLQLAYLYPGDIRDLLGETGFVNITIDGDCEGNPPNRDGCELFVQTIKGE